jgi:pentatricopeptide repeat protein
VVLADEWRVVRADSRDMLAAFNAAVTFYGRMGRPRQAWAVFDRMNAVGPKPDVVTFNTLIAVAAQQGNITDALVLFSQLQHAGGSRAAVARKAAADR